MVLLVLQTIPVHTVGTCGHWYSCNLNSSALYLEYLCVSWCFRFGQFFKGKITMNLSWKIAGIKIEENREVNSVWWFYQQHIYNASRESYTTAYYKDKLVCMLLCFKFPLPHQ